VFRRLSLRPFLSQLSFCSDCVWGPGRQHNFPPSPSYHRAPPLESIVEVLAVEGKPLLIEFPKLFPPLPPYSSGNFPPHFYFERKSSPFSPSRPSALPPPPSPHNPSSPRLIDGFASGSADGRDRLPSPSFSSGALPFFSRHRRGCCFFSYGV